MTPSGYFVQPRALARAREPVSAVVSPWFPNVDSMRTVESGRTLTATRADRSIAKGSTKPSL